VHVPEVHEPGDGARQYARIPDDDVVVVGVAVDHLAAQPRQRGHHLALEARERAAGERAARRVVDPPEAGGVASGMRQVPDELPARGGVLEAGECLVHLAEQPPERRERLRRARPRRSERRPRKPSQHPDEPLRPVGPGHLRHRVALQRLDDVGERQERGRASRWPSAAHCRATSGRSRAGCIAFSTNERPSAAVSGSCRRTRPARARAQAERPVERGREAGRISFAERTFGATLGLHRRILVVLSSQSSSRRSTGVTPEARAAQWGAALTFVAHRRRGC
jgi:hypothetical protein